MGKVYISREGYEKMRKELDYLKNVRRRELSREIGAARELGDISENAEYDAAKDAQGMNEKRIAELEDKLSSAQILDDLDLPTDKIVISSKIKLLDLKTDDQINYTLVSELEANFAEGKISITSPVGKGLLGHKQGDIVKIKIPAGTLEYKIIEISR